MIGNSCRLFKNVTFRGALIIDCIVSATERPRAVVGKLALAANQKYRPFARFRLAKLTFSQTNLFFRFFCDV